MPHDPYLDALHGAGPITWFGWVEDDERSDPDLRSPWVLNTLMKSWRALDDYDYAQANNLNIHDFPIEDTMYVSELDLKDAGLMWVKDHKALVADLHAQLEVAHKRLAALYRDNPYVQVIEGFD